MTTDYPGSYDRRDTIQNEIMAATGRACCVTIQQAATRIGVISPEMLYRLAREHRIPVVRIGKRVLVDESDIPGIIASFKRQPKETR
jgi:excisionase family DNA binding protein